MTIVFDLGMKRDLTQFPEVQQRHIEQRHPVKLRPDVADSLREGGIEPESGVDFVVLSHVRMCLSIPFLTVHCHSISQSFHGNALS